MSAGRLLEGPIHEDDRDDLKRKNVALQRRVDDLELEVQKLKTDLKRSNQVLVNLRDSPLNPVFRVLKIIFGELEAVDLPETQAREVSSVSGGGLHPKFGAALHQLEGKKRDVLKLIIDLGPQTISGMMAALKIGKQTAYDATSHLGRIGLIRKGTDGKFMLNE